MNNQVDKRLTEILAKSNELERQRDELVGDYSRDTEVLRGQVKYAEQQRDALLAELKAVLREIEQNTGYDRQDDIRAAIAAVEGRVE
jgi:hypothetical protein